jgi:hypothetical protein
MCLALSEPICTDAGVGSTVKIPDIELPRIRSRIVRKRRLPELMWYRCSEIVIAERSKYDIGRRLHLVPWELTKLAFPSSTIVDIRPISTILARQIHR